MSVLRHLLLPLLLLALSGPARAACAERALITGFFSNNVHVYDACTGAFERLLDDQNRIRGPLAAKIGPNGMLYVVSEGTGTILRYNATTLAFIDTFINTGSTFQPTSIAFGSDGDAYVGGFLADAVRRFDGTTGALKSTVIAGGGALDGPDCGMSFGPDGKLYVPSYNNNSVVRFDPATGAASTLVPPRTGGLNHTRAVVFEPGGQSFLVVSEGSGTILRFNAASGALSGTFASGLGQPSCMSYMADGRLLVATNSGTAVRVNASTGANEGPLFPSGSGGLDGSTYAVTIPVAAATVDASQVGSQYWIVGAGSMTGRILDIEAVVSATGTLFGDGFRPADVVRKRWGRVRVEFTGCRSGNFTWDSTGADSAGFGAGGYAITPAVATAFTTQCETAGFSVVPGNDFVNGSWWGGETRNGEGLFITRAPDGLVALAWFTHRPAM